MNRSRLESLLANFPKLTLGLIGDLFLDRYLEIDPDRHELSIETGLEAYQVAQVRNSPGALGTVINNLAALGVGRIVPLAVIGADGEGYDLLRELRRLPVDTAGVIQDALRQTPTYTKPLKQDAGGVWQELNRLDLRTRAPLPAQTEVMLLENLDDAFDGADGWIVLDQVDEEGFGVITPRVRERLADLRQRLPDKLIFVDSRHHIGRFQAGILKPNRTECLRAVGESPDETTDVAEAAKRLSRRTREAVYCTLGEEGMLLATPDGRSKRLPSFPVAGPVDIVGAGDSSTSGIVTSLASGATHEEAGTVGNLVASITIQQLGTTGTATREQVLARWDEVQGVESFGE